MGSFGKAGFTGNKVFGLFFFLYLSPHRVYGLYSLPFHGAGYAPLLFQQRFQYVFWKCLPSCGHDCGKGFDPFGEMGAEGLCSLSSVAEVFIVWLQRRYSILIIWVENPRYNICKLSAILESFRTQQ